MVSGQVGNNFVGEATASDKEDQVLAFVKSLGTLREDQSAYCDHACLQRYLRARGGDVLKAAKMLHSTLTWRDQFGIASFKINEFKPELLSQRPRQFCPGKDAEGHPVMVLRKSPEPFDPATVDFHIRYLVFTLECLVRAMGYNQETWVWIMDMAGHSRQSSPPFSVSLATQRIFADHYPERLHRCYIVDAPTIFYILFKALSPFIDVKTRNKIVFVSSSSYTSDGVLKASGSTGATDPTGFSDYYKFYAAQHDPTQYLEFLKSLGWEP